MIELVDLDDENWKECVTLTDKDDIHIASNLYSIAEAQFYEKAHSKAIFIEGKMVGYTMYGEDEDNAEVFFIDRFMIAEPYRRKGYGDRTMQKLISLGLELGYKQIETSTALENHPMQKLLEKNGFKTNREIRDEEIVYFFSE